MGSDAEQLSGHTHIILLSSFHQSYQKNGSVPLTGLNTATMSKYWRRGITFGLRWRTRVMMMAGTKL